VPESTRLVQPWITQIFRPIEGRRPAALRLALLLLSLAPTAWGQLPTLAESARPEAPSARVAAPASAPQLPKKDRTAAPNGATSAVPPASVPAPVASAPPVSAPPASAAPGQAELPANPVQEPTASAPPPPPVAVPEQAAPAPSDPVLGPPAPVELPADLSIKPEPAPAPVPAFAVKLRDSAVFSLRASQNGKSAEVRAREASQQLRRAIEGEVTSDVIVSRRGDLAVLTVGRTPIVELSEVEAKLAGASSLDVYAGRVASAMHEQLKRERTRAGIAETAFSFSLVVFFALIAFYLVRKVGELVERAQLWFDARSDKELTLRFQGIEFVRPAVLRSTGLLGLGVVKWFAQSGVAYTWLVVVLSLFESTRGYTQRLTGVVLAPLSQLMTRLATALPLLAVAALAAISVFVLVRFVGLFFASVARGETPLGWLPSDLAGPTSVLLRAAIVLAALVFLAPVVTGTTEGVTGRVGLIAIVALGLASVPVLACAVVGALWLYGRRLRVGEYVELGAHRGRVSELNLLELRVTTADRTELRVPHLLTLVHPLRLLGARPRLTLDLYVHPGCSVTEVRSLLATVAGKVGAEPSVEIVAADADAIRFRVAATCDSLEARTAFHIAALDALSAAGVRLGRDRA
jgi:small-conductance mechanosensitive channel